ncbi:hypothetical protein BKN38_09280 [Helicobacter sp. CLO-3]|nr:hypothetical protein BA723_03620 [Helicobacter sp. CLO-3]OHU81325.1 hypothetical protein BKN38_09280 [Helicobacter sp. CLO-3]
MLAFTQNLASKSFVTTISDIENPQNLGAKIFKNSQSSQSFERALKNYISQIALQSCATKPLDSKE